MAVERCGCNNWPSLFWAAPWDEESSGWMRTVKIQTPQRNHTVLTRSSYIYIYSTVPNSQQAHIVETTSINVGSTLFQRCVSAGYLFCKRMRMQTWGFAVRICLKTHFPMKEYIFFSNSWGSILMKMLIMEVVCVKHNQFGTSMRMHFKKPK